MLGVTLDLRRCRSPKKNLFSMYRTKDDAKTLGGKVGAAIERYPSLWKVVDTDSIKLSIEKSLMKSFAIYLYIESLIKSFVLQTGENCFVIENVFGAEPIRRLNCAWSKILRFAAFSWFIHRSPNRSFSYIVLRSNLELAFLMRKHT